MLTLIKNADIFAPEAVGFAHVLVGGGKILHVGCEKPDVDPSWLQETLDLEGAPMGPGLIDCHVHVTGGGGEDGFSSQAPPVPLTRFTRYGVTSVVGLLGTDDETRSTANLLARTRALREEGLSAWCWTGGGPLGLRPWRVRLSLRIAKSSSVRARSGLSPYSHRPCRAHKQKASQK